MNTRAECTDRPTEQVDWEAVYAELLPRVYNYIRYRIGEGSEAEDLTAATFERAWRARNRYRHDRGAFSTWLLTIARNVVTDSIRRRRREMSLASVPEVADGVSVEDRVQDREDFTRLGQLLQQLPERERDLIALKYGAGLTNRDIARQTGLSESNVGTILYRVVNKLRAAWEDSL